MNELTPALEALDQLRQQIDGRQLALFLDYDGTLSPIVPRPEDAEISDQMRDALRQLAQHFSVAIISGRDRPDVERRVAIDSLVYAGSHGFDISGPDGLRMEPERLEPYLDDLDAAESKLNERLGELTGVQVERKRYAIAVHYRRAADEHLPAVQNAVEEVRAQHPRLRMRGGKKIYELQPDIEWDKGRAVLWLLDALELDRPQVLPMYLGDDVTDEDAFAALADSGIGIIVGEFDRETHAHYALCDVSEVQEFLSQLPSLAAASK